MQAFHLEPEVPGYLGQESELDTRTHPPLVKRLHYVFEGWLGDPIVETFPSFLVTEDLARAIVDEHLTGAMLDDALVTNDPQFEELFPDEAAHLPRWRWLRPYGAAGIDDFWQDDLARLYVSARALRVIRQFGLSHADITEVTVEGRPRDIRTP